MISDNANMIDQLEQLTANEALIKRAVLGTRPGVFTDFYDKGTNLVVWQRNLSETLLSSVTNFVKLNPSYERNLTVTAKDAISMISDTLGSDELIELGEDIAELIAMFCYLFDQERAGLRLAVLNRAMCPRFHVDRVPCRLVTTYQGTATEWLSNQVVNRKKLGAGNNGLPDEQSGLFNKQGDIQQLNYGDVALLKGELWEDNENAGLVHRSPALAQDESRLLLTLDFSI